MGHYHHHHEHGESAEKNISVVFFLNLFFVIVEVVGGILTNSIAILSDAVHDIGDCLSLGVSWVLQKKSSKARDEKYSYGYKRYSLLGSIFLSGVLFVSSAFVLAKACGRLFNPETVDASGMLWLAVFGIIINGVAAFRVKRGHSLNERSVYLHIMEDVLGWAAVLAASIVMIFIELPVIDPILSIAISIWVLVNVFRNLQDVVKVLLQATPEDVDSAALASQLSEIPGVSSVHDLHVWSLDGESHIMTVHIVLDSASLPHVAAASSAAPASEHASPDPLQAIRDKVNAIALLHKIVHTTVEFESSGFNCGMNCDSI